MPPVILDRDFVGADKGLVPPVRRLQAGTFGLEISNLDRADPPDYTPGSVPRSPQFNSNVFALTNTPGMPRLDVVCAVRGFDPAATPIIWRLETSYVVAGTKRRTIAMPIRSTEAWSNHCVTNGPERRTPPLLLCSVPTGMSLTTTEPIASQAETPFLR